MSLKFYKCSHCGQIVEMIKDKNVPIICCGEKMQELIAGTVEASREKHIPVWKQDGEDIVVSVGSIEHPMIPEHYIEWVVIETDNSVIRVELKPHDKPTVKVNVEGRSVNSVYAYCNLHGLWRG